MQNERSIESWVRNLDKAIVAARSTIQTVTTARMSLAWPAYELHELRRQLES